MKIIFCIFILVSYSIHSQVMWQLKTDTFQKWFLQFNDEFTGEQLDETKWKSGMPWGNAQFVADNYFTKENVVINNNTLKLYSKKEKYNLKLTPWEIDSAYFKKNKKIIPTEYEFEYTSGEISTLKRFKNGYFEIRFKTQKQQYGMWPAFWLYGGKPNEEIDFFELKGERDNQLHLDMHCPNGCDNYRGGFLKLKKNWGGWITTKNYLSDGWNIVAGEWDKNYIKLFLNGIPMASFEGEFKNEQNLIVGTGPAKTGGAFSPGPNKTTQFPNYFEVDYIRVWSKEDTLSSITTNYKSFENKTETISTTNALYSTEIKTKQKFIYNKSLLDNELGTITLLPTSFNKYSLSIQGKNFGKIQIDIINPKNLKVAGFGLENINYYILDLSNLATGGYTININVLGKLLIHNITVINPDKIGIE